MLTGRTQANNNKITYIHSESFVVPLSRAFRTSPAATRQDGRTKSRMIRYNRMGSFSAGARWVNKRTGVFQRNGCCPSGESASCLRLRTCAEFTSVVGDTDIIRGCAQGCSDLLLGWVFESDSWRLQVGCVHGFLWYGAGWAVACGLAK